MKNKFFRATFRYSDSVSLIDGDFVDLLDFPEGGYVLLESKEPLYAATPGQVNELLLVFRCFPRVHFIKLNLLLQYVVLYNGDKCLGSMKIMNTGPSDMFYVNKSDSNNVQNTKTGVSG